MNATRALPPVPTTLEPGYDGLVQQALAVLPAHAPQWTDHNVSDPGITLIELLAYFSDALLYRLGRSGMAARPGFLSLLGGTPAGGDLDEALRSRVAELAQADCAVTPQDHERLALQALSALPHARDTRVLCLPRTAPDQPASDAMAERAGHTTLVVFCAPHATPAEREQQLAAVHRHLEPRRLLGSRLHVAAPQPLYLALRVRATASPQADRRLAARGLRAVLDAWQRSDADRLQAARARRTLTLSLAALAEQLASVPGVEGVDDIAVLQAARELEALHDPAFAVGLQPGVHAEVGRGSRLGNAQLGRSRLVRDGDGRLAAIALAPWEQARLVLREADLQWTSSDAAAR